MSTPKPYRAKRPNYDREMRRFESVGTLKTLLGIEEKDGSNRSSVDGMDGGSSVPNTNPTWLVTDDEDEHDDVRTPCPLLQCFTH